MENKLLDEIEQARQEIRRLKLSLRAEQLRTKISSEYTNFGLWEYDIATDICYQYKKLSGKYENNLEPIVHFRESQISWGVIHTDDLPAFNRFCDALERGDKEVSCELRAINDDCEVVRLRYEGKTICDEQGVPVKVIGRTLDVTEHTGGADNAAREGRDALTGAYTPEMFRDIVLDKRSGINRYKEAALLSVGIDGFRAVMAEQGTEYSDQLQKTVSDILTDISSREYDSTLSRIRDGEFLLYLSFTNMSVLNETVRRVINTVHEHPFGGASAEVSVGVSVFKNGRKLEEVYHEAAAALAEAQKSGGRCFMHYTPAMSARMGCGVQPPTVDGISLSGGAAKVYDLIIRAFCSENERSSMLREAFRAAGLYLGASSIYVFSNDNGSFRRHMTYNSTGKAAGECP